VSQLPHGSGRVLAEVAQQELAPAGVRLGVAAHHLDARAIHALACFGEFDGALHPRGQFGAGFQPDAAPAGLHGAGFLQLVQQLRQPPGREAGLLGKGFLGERSVGGPQDNKNGEQRFLVRGVRAEELARPERPISW
jgi:hypothetical protein